MPEPCVLAHVYSALLLCIAFWNKKLKNSKAMLDQLAIFSNGRMYYITTAMIEEGPETAFSFDLEDSDVFCGVMVGNNGDNPSKTK